MFFEKKRTQQIKESVQEVLEETLHKQEQNQLEQQMGQHHQVCESIEKNQKMIRKLSDTIEDFWIRCRKIMMKQNSFSKA